METLPGHLERMPPGQDLLQVEQLSLTQRERILAALAEVVAERGYQATTVELIVKRAGVARTTFYENFENREACLLAGFDEGVEEARGRIAEAAESEEEWPEQVRAGLAAFLEWSTENRALARICLVETMTAGPKALERYERALRSFTPMLAEGREVATDAEELPETLEDSIVGGIVWMVHQRLLRDEADQIPGLLATMLELTLVPYVGEKRTAEVVAGI